MKYVLSHFQVTPKQVVAFLVAFAVYVQNLGHLPETPRQWGVAVVGFLLSTFVPARDPNANKDPDAPSAPVVAGKPEGSLTRIGGAVVDPSTSVPTPGPGVPIADDGRTVPPPAGQP